MKRGRGSAGCILLLVILLITGQPGLVQAADNAAVSLEQAISTVKENFDIPAEFKEFQSGYSSYNGNSVWTLNWNAGRDPGGSFDAQVDSQTGEILNMSIWKYEATTTSAAQIPKISKEEALQKATQVMQRLASRHLSELQLVTNEDQLLPISSYGPPTYSIRWQRVSQGLPFPSDGVNMIIRSDDGSVSNYSLQWNKASLPIASGAVSLEQARQTFAQAGMLELIYYQPSRFIPLSSGEKPQVIVAYQLNHPSAGIIDASSGKPLENNENLDRNGFAGGGGGEMFGDIKMAQSSVNPQTAVLTPEEIKEVEKTTKLITQDQAIQAVKKWVPIAADLPLQQASLMSQTGSLATHVWNLSWSSQDSKSGGQSMNAAVNASNGELLNFYSSDQPLETTPGSIDRQGAQALAEAFLRQVQPQRFSNSKLYDMEQNLWMSKQAAAGSNPGLQYFGYRQIVNGIPFSNNNMTVMVDTVNKRIMNYNLNWQNIDFPAPNNILNSQQAADAFLTARPLTLSYYQESSYNGPGKVHLVYQPLASKDQFYGSYNLLDAKGGILLDWQGNPVKQHVLIFDDIQDNFAAADITLLGQAGLFGEYGTSFHPDEQITVVALLRAMLMSSDNNLGIAKYSNDDILSQARSRGWLKEDVAAQSEVSRVMMAKFMIRYLNLERATHAVGIYQVPYADIDSLPEGSLAFVALANGLGVLAGDGVNFEPEHVVSRAEAASALVRALRVEP